MKKRILSLFLALLLLSGCAAPAAEQPETSSQDTTVEETAPTTEETTEPTGNTAETVEFTDSVGRTVTVPANITKVAVSGPMAQIVLFALCPDLLVGIANEWDDSAAQFLDTEYYNLPLLGQLYGGQEAMNGEALLASGAEVVIDVGEPKDTVVEDLDTLQEQTGVPFVHISATTKTMGDAYRQLGKLLNRADEAEVLATYCEDTYARAEALAASVDKVDVLYVTGSQGLNVIAQGSYHAELLDLMTNNVAVVESPSSKGTGNEVSMEQLLVWNPEVLLFVPDSIYDTVAENDGYAQMTAIQTERYYEAPMGPYNWMGFPPSVQRYLGLLWMGAVLYPDAIDYDLQEEVTKYFDLFYHCDLTTEQYEALVANSIGKLEG